MSRSRTGQAISAGRRTPEELGSLRAMRDAAAAASDLRTWRRAQAVMGYIDGRRAADLATDLGVVRGAVNQWLRWFEVRGAEGLRARKSPGAAPRLTEEQKAELTRIIEAGPQSIGLTCGVWTGPVVGEVIRERFGVRYHNQHVPRLLHQLGFSVQRPRKRLARAEAEAQQRWLKERLPAIKKTPLPAVAS